MTWVQLGLRQADRVGGWACVRVGLGRRGLSLVSAGRERASELGPSCTLATADGDLAAVDVDVLHGDLIPGYWRWVAAGIRRVNGARLRSGCGHIPEARDYSMAVEYERDVRRRCRRDRLVRWTT